MRNLHSCRVMISWKLERYRLHACSTEADRNKLSGKERPERWGCGIVICAKELPTQSFVFEKTQILLQRAANMLQGQTGEAGGELV